MGSITDVLDMRLVRLRMRYARSPLPRFFAWWGRELLACLPERWRALLADRSEALLIETQARELVIWRQSGEHCVEFGRIALDAPGDEQKAAFVRLRAQIDDPNLRQIYCMRSARALRRSLSLPAATEDNLRQVLAFEMDRQTPFKADQVWFDFHVAERDAAARNLRVELIVVPRAQLDAEIGVLTGCGAALDGVDVWRDASGAATLGVNLLPADRRLRRKNLRLRMNLALAGAVVVLLAVVMLQSLSNRQAALEAMTVEVEKTQNDAKQVAVLKKTLQDTIASANFLSRKKCETPVTVELLEDLTQRLPDDTYLERMNVDEKGRIELQGLSKDYEKLPDTLKSSTVLVNPSFQGTIQPDPRSAKNRFNLVVESKKKSDCESAKDAKDAADRAGRKDAEGKHAPAAGNP
jgi:general secretion pathway protein L